MFPYLLGKLFSDAAEWNPSTLMPEFLLYPEKGKLRPYSFTFLFVEFNLFKLYP